MAAKHKLAAVGVGAAAIAALGAWLSRQYGPGTYKRFDTMFGPAKVYQVEDDAGMTVRLLSVGGIVQSGTYIDDERCYDLVFEYLKRYDVMFERKSAIECVLVMGCGGYDYPEHLIAHHPNVVVDAVEIDPAITAIAQRYFFLDRLVEEYETDKTGRLNLICADARAWLDETDRRYDAIVNDTFDAGTPAPSLITREAMQAIYDHLQPGGLYLTNIVSAIEGPEATFLQSQVALMRDIFAEVEVLACNPESLDTADNVIVVARRD